MDGRITSLPLLEIASATRPSLADNDFSHDVKVFVSVSYRCASALLLWSNHFSTLLNLASSSDLEQMPVDHDPLAGKGLLDALGDGRVVVGRKGKNGGTRSGKADTEQAGVALGSVGGKNKGEARDLREERFEKRWVSLWRERRE
jgi:hypothetical protein